MTQPTDPFANTVPSATDLLQAELAAVTGTPCGWTHPDHADGFICARATDHAGAQIMTDVHVALIAGQLVTAS